MKEYKYVIIGGGIAGTTAAETIREKDQAGTIAVIENEPYPLYSRVLLPNFLKNRVEREKVFLRSREHYHQKNIDIFFGQGVSRVNIERKEVVFNNNHSIHYEKLLIASGGRVNKVAIEGLSESDVLHFQTLDDAEMIKERMSEAKKAVVLGGSFIALELAEAFHINKKEVTMILRSDRFWKDVMDEASNKLIVENIEKNGVKLCFGEEIERGEGGTLTLSSGRKYDFDILCAGFGIKRNIEFLDGSLIDVKRGILANEYLETNVKDIFAAGDVAEYYDVITERYQMYGNWPAAFLQGKVAGLNMALAGQAGEKTACRHVSGYNIVNFGLNISFVGDISKDENTIVITRGDISKKEYSQLFLRKNLLVGATQINMNREKGAAAMLIDKKIDLSPHLKKLGDINFNLKDIIN